jgi:hypothetical protein
MDTFAYAARSLSRFVTRAARTRPVLSPPTTIDDFDPGLLAGRDLVWFKLHGRRGEPRWYGDNHTPALSAGLLASADLQGAVVYVANCWLADHQGKPGPMLHAMAAANPKEIIGGPGANYAAANRLAGVDLLGLYLRFFLQIGFCTYNALRFAKLRLCLKHQDLVTTDTLGFRIWTPLEILGPDPDPQFGRHEQTAKPNGVRP